MYKIKDLDRTDLGKIETNFFSVTKPHKCLVILNRDDIQSNIKFLRVLFFSTIADNNKAPASPILLSIQNERNSWWKE